jgi:predicted RNA-binding protein with RPS1 domain
MKGADRATRRTGLHGNADPIGEGWTGVDRDVLAQATRLPLLPARIITRTARAMTLDAGLGASVQAAITRREDHFCQGDVIPMAVVGVDPDTGNPILAREPARLALLVRMIERAVSEDLSLAAIVVRRNRGGWILDFQGIQLVLLLKWMMPSDNDLEPGAEIQVRPMSVWPTKHGYVCSRRWLRAERRTGFLATLRPGARLQGVVKEIVDYGVFISLGEADGLLHNTEYWGGRSKNLGHAVGDPIEVEVLSVNPERGWVSLTRKGLTPDPWNEVERQLRVGARITAPVASITHFGVFLEVVPDVHGLLHASEMNPPMMPSEPEKQFLLGQRIEVIVAEISHESRRLRLVQPGTYAATAMTLRPGEIADGVVHETADDRLIVALAGGYLVETDPVAEPDSLPARSPVQVRIDGLNHATRTISVTLVTPQLSSGAFARQNPVGGASVSPGKTQGAPGATAALSLAPEARLVIDDLLANSPIAKELGKPRKARWRIWPFR